MTILKDEKKNQLKISNGISVQNSQSSSKIKA